MDPLSVSAFCVGLVSGVTKVSIKIHGFVREVRDARVDLDSVTRELVSLKTVLEMLSEDSTNSTGVAFPPSLAKQISGILTNCGGGLQHIETSLDKYSGAGVRKVVKWTLEGKDNMDKLRSSLEAHKSALDIALDMVALSMARDIKTDTQEIRNDAAAIKDDTSQILAEIAALQARLPQEDRLLAGHSFTLQKYVDNLSSYAETSADLSDNEVDDGIDADTIQSSTQPNLDVIIEGPPRPGSSVQSSLSQPTQDNPINDVQRKINLRNTPPESPNSSFVRPAALDLSSPIYIQPSPSHPENARAQTAILYRRTSAAASIPKASVIAIPFSNNATDSQTSITTVGTRTNTGKRDSFFEKMKSRLSNKTTLPENKHGLPRMLLGQISSVYTVAFSPDSRLVASGSGDEKVRLWDSTTRAVLRTLKGHPDWVAAVVFSPDSQLITSGSGDKTVRLWDLTTGTVLRTLTGHTVWINAVAF